MGPWAVASQPSGVCMGLCNHGGDNALPTVAVRQHREQMSNREERIVGADSGYNSLTLASAPT